MNLNDYFSPVELDKPQIYSGLGKMAFYRNIYSHTQNNPIKEIKEFRLAVFGLGEDRNAVVSGASQSPDLIRNKLYQLTAIDKIKIIDLGNFKLGKSINDTYAGVKDVIAHLLNNDIVCVILGGSNDMVYPVVLNHFWNNRQVELTNIDARINYEQDNNDINSENYLKRVFDEKGYEGVYFNNIGSQMYLNNPGVTDFLNGKLFNICRLGEVKKNLNKYEPVIRNSDMVSFDICSVKQSDAQGQCNPSPNGFFGDEACQLALYSGMSERTSVFGIFDVNKIFDINQQTTGLAAQLAWHFIFGVAGRQDENPEKSRHFKKFMIGMETNNTIISFYKSEVTERWWLELTKNDGSDVKIFIPCTLEDYEKACRHEIPDVWWKACQRHNIKNE